MVTHHTIDDEAPEESWILGEYEPLGSREGAVIAAIKAAFAADTPESITMNSPYTSATGLCLSDSFTTCMLMEEVMARAKGLLRPLPNWLTLRQYVVLMKRFVEDRTVDETARRLGLSRDTILDDQKAGLQIIVRFVWREPDYVSGPRVRRLDPDVLAIFWQRLARAPRGPDGEADWRS